MVVSESRAKIQFTLQKIAIAWGFCMVVASVNRVAIADLGLPAILVATMIGVYTLFGPLQPVIGRICERWPIFGYRRTPYMLLGTLIGSMAFPFMPGVMLGMQAGSAFAYISFLLLFCAFGLSIAMQANVFLDLLKDVTAEETRSRVVTLTWTVQAFAMAGWAYVFGLLMPEYSHQQMQFMYSLSPLVMMSVVFLGLYGLETRLTPEQIQAIKDTPPKPVKLLEPMKESMSVLSYNRDAALFFVFIIFSLLAVFLQDMLQELWAKDLFAMSAGESTIFQTMYNGLQTFGMAACGIFVAVAAKKRAEQRRQRGETGEGKTLPMDFGKKLLLIAGVLTIFSFLLLAWTSYSKDLSLFYLFYGFSAFCLGLLVFPSISFMADMTIKGQESTYLGLWSLAQVIGLFLSFTVSGALYSLFVESGWLDKNFAFAVIFLLQAVMVVFCYIAVRGVTIEGLQAGARNAPERV